jgi:branched-chain amino acid transport system substrate-binding protein
MEVGGLAILEIGDGDFEYGFGATLRIGNKGKPHTIEYQERFPPAPEIPQLYQKWQSAYDFWGKNHRQARRTRLEFPPQTTNVSYWDELQAAARNLQQGLNEWFDRPSMRNLRECIVEKIPPDTQARLIIQTQNTLLRSLPWTLWQLLERRPNLEIVLSVPYVKTSRRLHNPVRILVILGDDTFIDLEAERKMLEGLPNAVPKLLRKPSRQEFNEYLFDRHWDILFFAGHSYSTTNRQKGHIKINETDYLSPNELKFAFQKAAQNGLQLAILNSCDGLGLAQELADLGIAHIIAMREPVQDRVAQEFLRYFLTDFAKGNSVCFSAQAARKKLQWLENDYPCASWLPIICQNPAASELTYPQWNIQKTGYSVAGIAIALTLTMLGVVQEISIRQRLSLGEKILVKVVSNPHKIAGTKAFWAKDYANAIKEFKASLKQVPDDPETLIYLNNAKIGDRPAFEIAVAVPAGKNSDIAQQILRGVAQAQWQINSEQGINGKPIKVKIANDDNDFTISPQLAQRFVESPQIMAIVGHNESTTSIEAAKVYRQGKLVMITPTSNANALTDRTQTGEEENGTYIYRTTLKADIFAEALVDYLVKSGKTTLAICSDSGIGDKSFVDSTIVASKNKLIVLDEEIKCDLNDDEGNKFDPVPILDRAKKAGADSLLLSPHVQRLNRAISLATANANSTNKLPLVGNFTLHQQITLKNGKAFQGMILPTLWNSDLPETVPFQTKAKQLWGSLEGVSVRSATAFDAVYALRQGIKLSANNPRLSANNPREKLPLFLRERKFPFPGVTGKIEFHRSGDRFGDSILIQVQSAPKASTGYGFALLQCQNSYCGNSK